jgi:uncharacterized protein YukE
MFAADIPSDEPEPPVAATAPAVEQPQPVAPPEAQQTEPTDDEPEDEIPRYSYIEIDDEDDEPEDIPVTAVADDDDEFSEFDDVDALRARLAKVEKEAQFHREQSLTVRRQQWQKRFAEKYPLASFDDITATSRRAFERAAVKSHNDNYTKLKPHIDRLQEAAKTLKETGLQEGKAEAVQRWGAPVTGPDVQTVDQAAADAQIQAAREKAGRTGDLSGLFKTMIRLGK